MTSVLFFTNLTITEFPQYAANGPDVNWLTIGSPDVKFISKLIH